LDKQRTFFYGFMVGFVLMILPVPHFFFWKDVTDNVEVIFRYSGFALMVVCGIPLIIDVFRNYLK
jgi:putative Mn2+ efflux pump MntP